MNEERRALRRSGKAANPKRVTREEIFEQLTKNASAEFEDYGVDYYIHIGDDGTFYRCFDAADATFTATITPADYDLTSEEWAEKSPEYFYDRETLDNTAFAEVVDNLTEQVNAYLAEVDDED